LKIIDTSFNWNGNLTSRNVTKYIILHHRAGSGDVQSIHAGHLKNGWSGIGYHFYIRKDGSVFRGRPIGMVGAHCSGYNDKSVGVCFEGNFENEKMSVQQIKSGKALVEHLKALYPKAAVVPHREFQSTACPGRNFPFEEIKKGESKMTVEDAVEIIQAKTGIEDETIEFLLCYKYGEDLVVKIAQALA
jgi:N-acetyl-anhydromuramyl-L-alanine amidase AmpD